MLRGLEVAFYHVVSLTVTNMLLSMGGRRQDCTSADRLYTDGV